MFLCEMFQVLLYHRQIQQQYASQLSIVEQQQQLHQRQCRTTEPLVQLRNAPDVSSSGGKKDGRTVEACFDSVLEWYVVRSCCIKSIGVNSWGIGGCMTTQILGWVSWGLYEILLYSIMYRNVR